MGKHTGVRLTGQQRKEIVTLITEGNLSYREVAKKFGVTYQTVANVLHQFRQNPRAFDHLIFQKNNTVFAVSGNGDVDRQRLLDMMNEDFCGGCGKEGLCHRIRQNDPRFPALMWLCGYCQSMECWQMSIVA